MARAGYQHIPAYTPNAQMKLASMQKPPDAKSSSTFAKSETQSARWFGAAEKGAPDAEHPQAEVAHVVCDIFHRGLKPIAPKKHVSLRLDQDVIEWCKAQGPGRSDSHQVLPASASRRFA